MSCCRMSGLLFRAAAVSNPERPRFWVDRDASRRDVRGHHDWRARLVCREIDPSNLSRRRQPDRAAGNFGITDLDWHADRATLDTRSRIDRSQRGRRRIEKPDVGLPVRVIHSEQKSVLRKRQRAHDLLRSRIELNHSSDLTLADPHEACERHDSRGIDGLWLAGQCRGQVQGTGDSRGLPRFASDVLHVEIAGR